MKSCSSLASLRNANVLGKDKLTSSSSWWGWICQTSFQATGSESPGLGGMDRGVGTGKLGRNMGGLTLPSAQLVQEAGGKDGATHGQAGAPSRGRGVDCSEQPTRQAQTVPEQTDVHVGCLGDGGGEAEHSFIWCTAILGEPVFWALGTKSLPSRNRNSRDGGDTG